jgi:hypothetical protein
MTESGKSVSNDGFLYTYTEETDEPQAVDKLEGKLFKVTTRAFYEDAPAQENTYYLDILEFHEFLSGYDSHNEFILRVAVEDIENDDVATRLAVMEE